MMNIRVMAGLLLLAGTGAPVAVGDAQTAAAATGPRPDEMPIGLING
jgi:hypothetical protein